MTFSIPKYSASFSSIDVYKRQVLARAVIRVVAGTHQSVHGKGNILDEMCIRDSLKTLLVALAAMGLGSLVYVGTPYVAVALSLIHIWKP